MSEIPLANARKIANALDQLAALEKLAHLKCTMTPEGRVLYEKDKAACKITHENHINPSNPWKSMTTYPPKEEDVLEEAYRITSGDRQAQYGPPDQDFTRTANMWSALFADKLSKPFEARDVAMAMILLKLSRETHKRKRDSSVDIAGYARCLHLCNLAAEERHAKEGATE